MDNFSEHYDKLRSGFDLSAYTVDDSRGVTLAGLRGAYVVERLNEVFGLIGHGWRFAFGQTTQVKFDKRSGGEGTEVVAVIALQYRIGEGGEYGVKAMENVGYFVIDGATERVWSAPIIGFGGNMLRFGGTPTSDAMKGAITDALSKAASLLGVGIAAYKGQLVIEGRTVVADGEQVPQVSSGLSAEDLNEFADSLLGTSPSVFGKLMAKSEFLKKFYAEKLLRPLATVIQENDLVQFVKDNSTTIFGREVSFADMTPTEATFLAGMIASIVSDKEFSWQDALAVASCWDRESGWNSARDLWAAEANKEEEAGDK